MTRRSLFAMLLGVGSAPLVAARRPGSWFVEQIALDRMHFTIMRNMSMCVDPPLLLQSRPHAWVSLKPFPLRPGPINFHVEE